MVEKSRGGARGSLRPLRTPFLLGCAPTGSGSSALTDSVESLFPATEGAVPLLLLERPPLIRPTDAELRSLMGALPLMRPPEVEIDGAGLPSAKSVSAAGTSSPKVNSFELTNEGAAPSTDIARKTISSGREEEEGREVEREGGGWGAAARGVKVCWGLLRLVLGWAGLQEVSTWVNSEGQRETVLFPLLVPPALDLALVFFHSQALRLRQSHSSAFSQSSRGDGDDEKRL